MWSGVVGRMLNAQTVETYCPPKKEMRSLDFAHKDDSKCGGEGNLHRYAKELLFTAKRLTLPNLPFVPNNKTWTQEFESVSLEVPLDEFKIDCFMPDDDKRN